MILTKSERDTIYSALIDAIDWSDSLIDSLQKDPHAAYVKRLKRKYERLKNKFVPHEQQIGGPDRN